MRRRDPPATDAAFERWLRAARFESTTTIEEFDFSYNQKTLTALISATSILYFVVARYALI
jgi:hypothetical protein